jgi:hypothetical protein
MVQTCQQAAPRHWPTRINVGKFAGRLAGQRDLIGVGNTTYRHRPIDRSI